MSDIFASFRFVDALDILVVAFLTYRLLVIVKGTRAIQILGGLTVLLGLYGMARALQLSTLNWLFEEFAFYLVLALVILFQEDIRRALARVGNPLLGASSRREKLSTYQEIARACFRLADQGHGALIAVEREGSLEEVSEQATPIEAVMSQELLVAIFQPSSPVHDGAVVVRKDRIGVAGAFLPLSTRMITDPNLGTRHRAALGQTETTDAMLFVVSEERRAVSIAFHGELYRVDSPDELRLKVQELLSMEAAENQPGVTSAVSATTTASATSTATASLSSLTEDMGADG